MRDFSGTTLSWSGRTENKLRIKHQKATAVRRYSLTADVSVGFENISALRTVFPLGCFATQCNSSSMQSKDDSKNKLQHCEISDQ